MKKIMSATMRLCTLAVMLVVMSFTMSAADSLLGKWQQVVNESGVKVVTTYEFKADGNMKQVMDMNSSTAPRIKMQGEGVCKYTFQNNTLTFKFDAKDLNFPVFEVDGVDAATTQAIMEQTKQSMGAMEQKITDIKINGNELTGKFNGNEFKLTRL